MERELKFRAWDEGAKRMLVTGFQILGEVTCFNIIEQALREEPLGRNTLDRIGDVVIMQYIGLKDYNGKEIYEGDILERIGTIDDFTGTLTERKSRELSLVELKVKQYKSGEISFGIFLNTKKTYSERSNPATYEIIGNIYENPELLKQ